jgi:ribonuclease inhibitor
MGGRREVVEIDLSAVTTPDELQLLLLRSLDFPDWYGCNWNAFWDAITGLVEMPRRLRLVGWAGFAARLPGDARLMRECLDDMAAQYPADAAQVEYAAPGAAADRAGIG